MRIALNTWPPAMAPGETPAPSAIMGREPAGGKDDAIMWTPGAEEFRLLRMVGLVTLALIFGARVIPPLQPHARLIGIAAAACYVLFGLAVIAWHALGGW
jgi:hypothetical protein